MQLSCHRNFLFTLVLICVASFATSALAETKEAAPIRVLLTYGGHGFQEAKFFQMFDKMPGIKVTRVDLRKEANALKPGIEKDYNVIVRYDMTRTKTTESQKENMTKLLDTGIGLVAIHHSIGSHSDWAGYREMIGGAYLFSPIKVGDKKYSKSKFSHGEMDVKVENKKHPITAGIKNFRIRDEMYKNCYLATTKNVLLTTNHPKCDKPLLWTIPNKKANVCYFMLGHDNKAWAHPAYPKLLLNAIRWAAKKSS